ncbi:bifunctional riboflavin kinase/FAD synthetase [Hydrogenimonas sp.]
MSGFTVTSTVESIALGHFDGMHRGHQALFARLGERGAVGVVEHYRATLTPHIYRARYVDAPLFFYDLDAIRQLAPEAFVRRLERDFPALRTLVVGSDFRFGSQRSGDVEHLRELFGGSVEEVEEIFWEGRPVHTRFIRRMIESGDVAQANRMLGHPYETWGRVVAGQGIGAKELVPTLNALFGRFLLPKAGVYKTQTCVAGVYRDSVTFLGHRHTADGAFAVETHLLGEAPAEPVRELSIRWLRFIRQNRRFESFAELKAQIERDIEVAREG